MKRQLPILFDKKENCCGCSACYINCSVGAISMEADDEGFLYPVIRNKDRCIFCYSCIKICAFKKDQKAKGYL